jgi:7-cyano-7-deazaguanine synthase
MGEEKKAVVLLSGGLDSATTLAIATAQGYLAYAISFEYGQRHAIELLRARQVAQSFGAKGHLILQVDLAAIGGSSLTAEIEVPKNRSADELSTGIPVTYVPARNTIFLSLALGWAETLGSSDIFIGVNALDYSGYPDCRPEFISSFERTANLGTRAGVEGLTPIRIHTPLIAMTKAEIINTGLKLGVDYSLTHSCYDPAPGGLACGRCDSCLLRLKGFAEAGTPDPLAYALHSCI